MTIRGITALLTASAALMAVASPAHASSASTAGGEFPIVRYDADPGEANHLSISDMGATLTIEDSGATITAGEGCTSEAPSRVTCTVADGQASYRAYLGDGDDEATVLVRPGGRFDIPDGGGEHSSIDGGDGNDTLHGSAVEDWLWGGPGDDVADGEGGDDFLSAGSGNDRLAGGPGDDELSDAYYLDGPEPPVSSDRDVMSGGPGRDTLYYGARTEPQSFTFDGLANDGVAGEQDNVGDDFERIYTGAADDTIVLPPGGAEASTGPGDDRVVGGSGDDQVHGGTGADWIDGGAGADWIMGGGGDDHLVGGPGYDHIIGDDDFPPNDSGDDTIDSRDGSFLGDPLRPADWVICGGGTDTYLPDFADYYQLAPSDGCENVTVPPDPLHSLTAATTATATAGAKTARLAVRCPFSGGGICDGRLTLMSTGGPSRVLATGRLKLAPGTSVKLTLKLAVRARQALRRKRKLQARAVITTATHKAFQLGGPVTIRRRGPG